MQSYQTTFIGDGQDKAAPTTIILSPQNDYLKEFSGRCALKPLRVQIVVQARRDISALASHAELMEYR